MHLNIYKVRPISSEATTRLAFNAVWICAPRPARSNGTDLYILHACDWATEASKKNKKTNKRPRVSISLAVLEEKIKPEDQWP